jgi:hypothetical protein
MWEAGNCKGGERGRIELRALCLEAAGQLQDRKGLDRGMESGDVDYWL